LYALSLGAVVRGEVEGSGLRRADGGRRSACRTSESAPQAPRARNRISAKKASSIREISSTVKSAEWLSTSQLFPSHSIFTLAELVQYHPSFVAHFLFHGPPHIKARIMHRAFAARARQSALNAPRLRSSLGLQQQRFAHKVRISSISMGARSDLGGFFLCFIC